MGSGSVNPPPISNEEQAAFRAQTALLNQQRQLTQQSVNTQNLLAPFLYKSLGLTPTINANGKITGFTQDPAQVAIQDKQTQITGELLDRQQQALEGNLPVDPALTRSLNESEAQLHSQLLQNLGPGYETSTSGATALDRFQQTKQATLEGARRGDLTMAEQLALGMQSGQNQNSGFLQASSSQNAGMNAQFGSLFGQNAAGYQNPLSVLENMRQQNLTASEYNSQQQAALMSGIGQGVGSVIGIGGAALLSSKDFKEDLGPVSVLDNVKALPIRRWKYKKEMGQGEDPHIGPYAEDFKDRFGVGDGKFIHLIDYLGVNLAATKEIAQKLDKMEHSLFLEKAQ